jgi:hypothetical protein
LWFSFIKKHNTVLKLLKNGVFFWLPPGHMTWPHDIVHFSLKNSITYNNDVMILITGSLKITDLSGRQGTLVPSATVFWCCLSSHFYNSTRIKFSIYCTDTSTVPFLYSNKCKAHVQYGTILTHTAGHTVPVLLFFF